MPDSPEQLASLEDAELVKLCQQQLPDQLHAYQELISRHESLVFSTCLSMLGSLQDAEEISQDAFLQVFRKIHQFEGRSSFKTWLYRIVYNMCLNRRKSMASRRERENRAGEEIIHQQELKHQEFFVGSGVDDRVTKAFDRLDADEQEIIRLRFVAELSLNEIAEHLNLKLSATKMRLYRAMEEFKKLYSSLPAEETTPSPSSPTPTTP